MDSAIIEVRGWLRGARTVAVLTGAGISAESGIPTFRGASGLWKQFRPEDLATPEAFHRDPKLVWEWYDWRRGLIGRARPNPGHQALVGLEERVQDFALITQNVDGLHRRAGSRNVLAVHGEIWIVRCVGCGAESVDRRTPLPELPPRCNACGALLRPGVVWFGESLPQDVWEAAETAARNAEVFLVAGTSAQVYPAAGLVGLARRSGAKVVEINLEETPFSSQVDVAIQGRCGVVLPELLG